MAEKMKTVVERSNAAYKESAGRLNTATLDRAGNAVTYRIYGCEKQRSGMYEKQLDDYEKTAVRAGMQVVAMPPLYQVISMGSTVLILYFGSKNVLNSGWAVWNIAAFTTFLSCYGKLAVKSSKAAKLFNSGTESERFVEKNPSAADRASGRNRRKNSRGGQPEAGSGGRRISGRKADF